MCQFRKVVVRKHVACDAPLRGLVNRRRRGCKKHFAAYQDISTSGSFQQKALPQGVSHAGLLADSSVNVSVVPLSRRHTRLSVLDYLSSELTFTVKFAENLLWIMDSDSQVSRVLVGKALT